MSGEVRAHSHYSGSFQTISPPIATQPTCSDDAGTLREDGRLVEDGPFSLRKDTKFYDAIRAVLSRRTQISSVESKLRTHQNEESEAVSSIQAVARSKVDYGKAIERVSGLKSRVSEIREVLKKLEHESAWEEVLPVDRKREWDQCPESHLAIKKEDKRVG